MICFSFKAITSVLLLATLSSSSPVPQDPLLGRVPLPGMPMMTATMLMPMPTATITDPTVPAPTSTLILPTNIPPPPAAPGAVPPMQPGPMMPPGTPQPPPPVQNPPPANAGQYVFTDCSSAPALAAGSATLSRCVSNACDPHSPQTQARVLLDGCTALAAGALATNNGRLPANW